MSILEMLRIIIGSIFVLFLPGYVWSYVLFKKDEMDIIERLALSFGLSIALVPLTVFWVNYLLKIKINLTNVTLIIVFLIATAIFVNGLAKRFDMRRL